MTALTFESINYSPRRAAVRRQARPAPHLKVVEAAAPASVAAQAGNVAQRGNKRGIAALFGVALVLHAGVWVALHQGGQIEALPVKSPEPLAIEFAPPPPPPPEPPKVQPQVAKVAPPRAAPQIPVVQQAPVDNGPPSENTVQVAQAAPPAPVAAAPVPPPAPEPVTEPRGYAGYRNNPPPDYPSLAQDRGLQGQVILKVRVLATGKPESITVDKTSGHKILDDAAIKAVTAWTFDPAKRGQTPIDGWVKVPLNFKLS